MTGRNDGERLGLLVGLETSARSRARAALDSLSMPCVDAFDASAARELVTRVRFESVVVGYPLPDGALPPLLDAVRRPKSSSRASALVLLAGRERRREAESFVGLGANRVVPLDELDPELPAVLDRLSRVAPRRQMVVPGRIEVSVGATPKRLFGQTVNVSASGMLLKVPHRLPVGQELGFELFLGGESRSVRGRARVVRQTLQQREPFAGIGLSFLSFADGDDARLARCVPGVAGIRA